MHINPSYKYHFNLYYFLKKDYLRMLKFITSQGSEYFYDESIQKSKRHKKSGGSEQGESFPFMPVVFIKERVNLYYPNIKIYVGLFTKAGMLTPVKEIPQEIGKNEKLVVVEVDRKNPSRPLNIQRAFLNPAIGLFPFESGYNDKGQYIKHLGNKIIEIVEEHQKNQQHNKHVIIINTTTKPQVYFYCIIIT